MPTAFPKTPRVTMRPVLRFHLDALTRINRESRAAFSRPLRAQLNRSLTACAIVSSLKTCFTSCFCVSLQHTQIEVIALAAAGELRGLLWKTSKIKSRNFQLTSRNHYRNHSRRSNSSGSISIAASTQKCASSNTSSISPIKTPAACHSPRRRRSRLESGRPTSCCHTKLKCTNLMFSIA